MALYLVDISDVYVETNLLTRSYLQRCEQSADAPAAGKTSFHSSALSIQVDHARRDEAAGV